MTSNWQKKHEQSNNLTVCCQTNRLTRLSKPLYPYLSQKVSTTQMSSPKTLYNSIFRLFSFQQFPQYPLTVGPKKRHQTSEWESSEDPACSYFKHNGYAGLKHLQEVQLCRHVNTIHVPNQITEIHTHTPPHQRQLKRTALVIYSKWCVVLDIRGESWALGQVIYRCRPR